MVAAVVVAVPVVVPVLVRVVPAVRVAVDRFVLLVAAAVGAVTMH